MLSGTIWRDEKYLARLRTTGYQLSDENSSTRYGGPTLVLTGREDRIVGYADQFHALPSYPQATYAVISGAGHYLPFEQPTAFRSFIRGWLASCLPTPQ